MLHWRLLLGTVIIATLVALCWVDHLLPVPGMVLVPIAVGLAVLASGEIVALMSAAGARPLGWVVFGGNVLLVLAAWLAGAMWCWAIGASQSGTVLPGGATAASAEWVLLAFGLVVLLAFLGEMQRFEQPGEAVANVSATVSAVGYVGVLLSFVVLLRLAYGVAALASLVIVVKMGDTGAYTVGRLVGRHKMAPRLSPAKTLEGAAGAVLLACASSWVTFALLIPAVAPSDGGGGVSWGWLPFGLMVGLVGMVGDLAESLLKRDARCKDSSRWMPGFGGVLDVLDSVLLAAPAAYACWWMGLVGT